MKDKKLFTPGPLTTGDEVKRAMLHDLGSRDETFVRTVAEVRESLLQVAGVSRDDGYEVVPMQGSGTFGLESVISSVMAPDRKLLVVSNGAYGERLLEIAARHGIGHVAVRFPESRPADAAAVGSVLADEPGVSHVAMVHCETSTGMLNPVEPIGRVVARSGKRFIVDSMSGFGAVPLDLKTGAVDFLVTSANKCLEGVPGLSLVICRREALQEADGRARTLSLDLLAQWRGLESNGQFRFTPPTHAILALARALDDLAREGGVAGRASRYGDNHRRLTEGMRGMGFATYLPDELQSYIITSFRVPADSRFEFATFYAGLGDRGFVIYPGKVSTADCFRIGTIGRIEAADVRGLLEAVRQTLDAMGVETGAP